jgi:hypothetical protein
MLHPAIFRFIDKVYGPHNIDRFASMTTTQLPLYNSLYYDPLSAGVDALSQRDWRDMNNYVNAPFHLIPRVLDVIQEQQAQATIIAPYWPAQSWFAHLREMSTARPIQLPMTRRTIWAVNHRAEPLRNPRWKVFAWRICGGLRRKN